MAVLVAALFNVNVVPVFTVTLFPLFPIINNPLLTGAPTVPSVNPVPPIIIGFLAPSTTRSA